MPELPEVEIIKRGLQEFLVGHTILSVRINDPKIFSGKRKDLLGKKVQNIKRLGKGLIIELSNKTAIVIHLKMTGQIIYRSSQTTSMLSKKVGKSLPNKHTRIIFKLSQNAHLFYNDVRRFGWVRVMDISDANNLPFFRQMGPEPFKDLTLEKLQKIVEKSNTPIKTLLLDQHKIGGIGNIYANEALWQSCIDPRRKASSLTHKEVAILTQSIHAVLEESISHGASSSENYVNALGQEGGYQKRFKVYARAGGICRRCKGEISRITLGGRGTFLCLGCQK